MVAVVSIAVMVTKEATETISAIAATVAIATKE